jgi:hypothetical protein
MYLLHDIQSFAYKPPDYNKILDKWLKVSKATEPFNDATAYHRQMMLGSMRNRQGLELLKKEYKDSQGRIRKLVTGMAQVEDKPDRLVVKNLVGNPFSKKDKKFKGALESVRKRAGDKGIEIDSITPRVEMLYNKKLGDKRI